MKKYVKTALWALGALIATNPAYDPSWVQIALGCVCLINAIRNTGEIIKEV